MSSAIACEGAPRDLGLDQGRALRARLRRDFEAQPSFVRWRQRLGRFSGRGADVARDLRRHFPQQSEFLEGLVSGTGLPPVFFAERLAAAAVETEPAEGFVGAALAVLPRAPDTGALLARSVVGAVEARRSRPEGGFASIELTFPWLSSAIAGVNEGGLGAAVVGEPGKIAAGGCSVPAPLLLQDCLARFDGVKGAIDWCLGRPAGGHARLVFADAAGEVAAVDCSGESRIVVQAEAGLVVAGGLSFETGRAPSPLENSDAVRLLGGRAVLIEPAARRIALAESDGAVPQWLEVEPAGGATVSA